jgi:hypothetical protein
VPSEFDARAEAAKHSAEVLLPLRRILLVISAVMIVLGGSYLVFVLYHLSNVGVSSSNEVLSTVSQVVISAVLVSVGVYLLTQCPSLKRPLPTVYLLDSDGFTAKWDNGATVRLAWLDPKLRLFMRDTRDLADVKGCTTLISRGGSFVPLAVPSNLYDQVLSEAKTLGLVTRAHYSRGPGGLMIHTATVRGRNLG